jgi:hypothetical protein
MCKQIIAIIFVDRNDWNKDRTRFVVHIPQICCVIHEYTVRSDMGVNVQNARIVVLASEFGPEKDEMQMDIE